MSHRKKAELFRWLKHWTPDWILDWYAAKRPQNEYSKFHHWDTEQVFDYIYRENYWSNPETVSGPGSTVTHMKPLFQDISEILDELEISSITDAACGDFNWMQHIDLKRKKYHGIDIVGGIIETNKYRYERSGIVFTKLDVLREALPSADLVIMRDLLVHFSFEDIRLLLANLKRTDFGWLMTTTFRRHTRNWNISTGNWRPLNLERHPFYFPKPYLYLPEKVGGREVKSLKGKSLAFWDRNVLMNYLDCLE